MRRAIASLKRCIATPEVNKHRLFVWMETVIVPDHKVHAIARDDDYFFGVLHSNVHEQWTLATCSWIGKGNDPSYNSSSTFDTFPFPWPPGSEPSEAKSPVVKAIADAARNLVMLRQNWLDPSQDAQKAVPETWALEVEPEEVDLKDRTLTKLYNQRPAWLDNAHRTLDQAVFAAYGWPYPLPTQEILARLLALNHQRATKSTAPDSRE